jgi:hypothetical protein
MHLCWYRLLVQVVTGCCCYRLFGCCRLIGTGCYRLLVQVDSDRLTVAVFDSVTGCLHLAFIFQGGWMGQGKGVVASFRLVSRIRELELPSGWSLRTRWL